MKGSQHPGTPVLRLVRRGWLFAGPADRHCLVRCRRGRRCAATASHRHRKLDPDCKQQLWRTTRGTANLGVDEPGNFILLYFYYMLYIILWAIFDYYIIYYMLYIILFDSILVYSKCSRVKNEHVAPCHQHFVQRIAFRSFVGFLRARLWSC